MQQTTQEKSLSTEKFLTIAVNLLNRAFLESTRTEAKKLFRQLAEGQVTPITNLQMEDKSVVRVDLALNRQLYPGNLSFSSFRTSLTLLLANAAETLKAPEELRTFRNEQDPKNSVLFGVSAVVIDGDTTSVLALGAETGRGGPNILLQLSYLDPGQFQVEADSAAGETQA